MRVLTLRVILIVVGLWALPPPLAAQSEKDCQAATKLHAEQELIQELFAKLGQETEAEHGPALGPDNPKSLQGKMRAALRNCQNEGGTSNACGNYKRIRDAWLINNSAGSPSAAMQTDPHTCEIQDPDTKKPIDPRDRPSGWLRASRLGFSVSARTSPPG